LKQRHWS